MQVMAVRHAEMEEIHYASLHHTGLLRQNGSSAQQDGERFRLFIIGGHAFHMHVNNILTCQSRY